MAVTAAAAFAAVLLAGVTGVSVLAVRLHGQVTVTRAALTDADRARQTEARQRAVADAQRAAAEAASRAARREVARSRSDNLVQSNLYAQALVQEEVACSLGGGGWEDGLRLSHIVHQCRGDWQRYRTISTVERPACGAFMTTPAGPRLVLCFATHLDVFDWSDGTRLGTLPLADRPIRAVGFADDATGRIVVATRRGLLVASAAGRPAVTAAVDLGGPGPLALAASRAEVVVAVADGTARIYGADLSPLGSHPLPAAAAAAAADARLPLGVSADGRWVICGGPTSRRDCLVWDRTAGTATTRTLAVDQLTFATGLTGYALSQNGDSDGVYLTRFKPTDLLALADPPASATAGPVADVPLTVRANGLPVGTAGSFRDDDTGRLAFASCGDDSVLLSGDTGLISWYRDGSVGLWRYSTLLGREGGSPTAVATWGGGSLLAVARDGGVVVFTRSADADYDAGPRYFVVGPHAALGPTARFTVWAEGDALNLQVMSAEPGRPFTWYPLGRLPTPPDGWNALVCGMAVSADQRTVAVRSVASDGLLRQPDEHVAVHVVTVYPGLDPRIGRPGPTPPRGIRLADQGPTATWGASNEAHARVLLLSADGAHLLVGTRTSDRACAAELYRTADAHLVRSWPADAPLAGTVLDVASGDHFAAYTPGDRDVRLIDWATGQVQGHVATAPGLAAVCVTPDGREMVASVDAAADPTPAGGRRIVRYALPSGAVLGEVRSPLSPAAWSPRDDVFVAFRPDDTHPADARFTRGSTVLADAATGDTIQVLDRRQLRGGSARFTADGQGLLVETDFDTAFHQNLPAAAADRLLGSDPVRPDAAAEPPRPPPAVPVARLSAGAIDVTDTPALAARVGTGVVVEGLAVGALPTATHGHLNVLLGPFGHRILIFIRGTRVDAFDAAFGNYLDYALSGHRVRVRGRLAPYGGRTPGLAGLLQIEPADPSALTLLPDRPATGPAAPGGRN